MELISLRGLRQYTRSRNKISLNTPSVQRHTLMGYMKLNIDTSWKGINVPMCNISTNISINPMLICFGFRVLEENPQKTNIYIWTRVRLPTYHPFLRLLWEWLGWLFKHDNWTVLIWMYLVVLLFQLQIGLIGLWCKLNHSLTHWLNGW